MKNSIEFFQQGFSINCESNVDFEALWNFPTDWVEPINQRHGGWSGVTRHSLDRASGPSSNVYLKRQENQTRRRAASHLARRPSFWFEMRILRHLMGPDPLSPTLICYGQRTINGQLQALLITEALDDYVDMDLILGDNCYQDRREEYLLHIGTTIKKLHRLNVTHGALYTQHIFVEPQTGHCRFIDFERARFCNPLIARKAKSDDLERLFRRSPQLAQHDRDTLMRGYTEG